MAPDNKVKAKYIFCLAAMILFYEVHTTETRATMLTGESIAAVRKKSPHAISSPI